MIRAMSTGLMMQSLGELTGEPRGAWEPWGRLECSPLLNEIFSSVGFSGLRKCRSSDVAPHGATLAMCICFHPSTTFLGSLGHPGVQLVNMQSCLLSVRYLRYSSAGSAAVREPQVSYLLIPSGPEPFVGCNHVPGVLCRKRGGMVSKRHGPSLGKLTGGGLVFSCPL